MIEAEKRLAGMKAIDPTLDLGNGLSVADYEAMITGVTDKVDDYNEKLSKLDEKANILDDKAEELAYFNRRILSVIGSVYGFDSNEYEMAGGTRRSEIDRSPRNSDANETPEQPEE